MRIIIFLLILGHPIQEHVIWLHLFRGSLFFSIKYSFLCRSLTFFFTFTLRYLKLLEAFVKLPFYQILFLFFTHIKINSLVVKWPSVQKSCQVNLLSLRMYQVHFFGFYTYTVLSPANNVTFLSFFLILTLYLFFLPYCTIYDLL